MWYRLTGIAIMGMILTPIGRAVGSGAPPPQEVRMTDRGVRLALEQLDALLTATVKERDLPGLSAGVVYDQDLIWSKGYGLADLEQQIPADADTIYELASITKVFNAVMLMQLRDAGKLSLDDPVEKYLPEFTMRSSFADPRPPTFRQLVSHTAGLPRDFGFDTQSGEIRQFPAAVVLAGLKDREFQYPPYSGFHYSNLGVYIVGQALQRIAGVPYTQYVQQHVLTPLGMTRTGWEYTDAMRPHRAIGYLPAEPGKPRRVAPLFVPGDFGVSAGGLQSSVTDMAKLLSLFFREGPAGGAMVLGSTSLREMYASVVPAPNWRWGYGIGWEVEYYPQHTGIGHGGGAYGFSGRVCAVPDLKLGLVVLVNQDVYAGEFSRQAMELLLPAFEKLAAAPLPQHTPPLPAYAAAFTGHYGGPYGNADIVIRDGRLLLLPTQGTGEIGPPWLLSPQDEHTLLIVSGSADFNGHTIAYQPAAGDTPASIRLLEVTFPRTGPPRDGGQ